MDAKEKLIRNLKQLRNNEFYIRLGKLLLLFVFVIITPIAIFERINDGDILTLVILLIAEILFIGISYVLLKDALELKNITSSRIYQCIVNPVAVTEIIVTPTKIVFELKGMEDESILLKPSSRRIELVNNIKEVFGENKVVITINT
jgi:hypothetical protein